MSADAHTVRVYAADLKSLSQADVGEWLSHLGPVENIKLQYDAARGSSCYAVRFRSPSAAQNAVQHLSGVALKGIVVEILSDLYRRRNAETTAPAASDSSCSTTGGAGGPSALGPSPHLPHNHLVPRPSSLAMDAALLPVIPDVLRDTESFPDFACNLEKLKTLQEKLVHLSQKLAMTSNASEHASLAADSGAAPVGESTFFSNTTGIVGGVSRVAAVVAHITADYGPVTTSRNWLIAAKDGSLRVCVRFLFAEDAQRFSTDISKADISQYASHPILQHRWAVTVSAPQGESVAAAEVATTQTLQNLMSRLPQFD